LNAVFIHIPKTAGIYIQEALGLDLYRFPHRTKRFTNKGRVTFGHQPYMGLLKKGIVSKEFDRSAFKFAICRNPYERAVSHYFYAKRKHPEIIPAGEDFLTFTERLPERRRSVKFRQQATWIENINMSFIGRFETLNKDLSIVAEQLDINIKRTPRRNEMKYDPYQTYYCETSRENIKRFYDIDFKTFGYGK
jgi:hypothetical protein